MNELANTKFPVKFDFLFIGLGAANCLLILRLHDAGLLRGKTIAIIEPNSKSTNDRTFCFWATEEELSKLKLEQLVSYSWDTIEIKSITKQQIKPLRYFHIKGIDLYSQTKNILLEYSTTFFASLLKETPQLKPSCHEIKLENETLYATKVFDSRPPIFLKPQKNQSHLYQSFYGLKIKTTTKSFDTSTMVMMDFNVPQNNFTQFVYVLPYDQETALIELTRFGDKKLEAEEAQLILDIYIKELGVSFEVLDVEQGLIPMSSAIIKKDNFGESWINMGSRANMLKSTTGYAFHAMAEDAIVQTEAIKNKQVPVRKPRKKRFVFYDRLLLKILSESPENGKIIFETLFKKVSTTKVLSFLREKTSIYDEISIFSKLPVSLFIKAALKDFILGLSILPVLALPFLFTIFALIASNNNFKYVSWSILAMGFLTVGLSHGALDHLTSKTINNKKQLLHFSASYLIKGMLVGLVWLFFSDLALLIFIAYSAWHFGQADFKEWNLKHGWQSFLWGIVVLFTILFFHFKELNSILQQIPNLHFVSFLKKISNTQLVSLQILMIASGLFLAHLKKSNYIIYTLSYLLLSSFLPLLVSFGIYFVWQHSVQGWRHLSLGLNKSSSTLWLKSLPFSIGGAFIIFYFLFFAGSNYLGIFFIVLSCLSFPHVFSMHHFYERLKRE